MSLKYKRKDYDKLRDQFYQNPGVNPISKHKITIGGDTYNKLVNEFGDPYELLHEEQYIPKNKLETFHQFEQLPLELQTDIYNRNIDTLVHSSVLSTTSNKATKDVLCGLEITNKEYIKYINVMAPERTYAFPYNLQKSKFNATKFILDRHPQNNLLPEYRWSNITINIYDNLIVIDEHIGINILFNDRDILPSKYDLLTSYFIYRRRKTCQHIPNYAKKQVLSLLTLKYKQVHGEQNYISLLGWYFYLRANLTQFPYELPKNEYYNYVVAVDTQGNITNDADDILIQLYDDCDVLYKALLEQLTKL